MKIGLGAQFGDAPAGKLAKQRAAESLAIFQARPAAADFAIGGIGEIGQSERAGAGAETLNFKLDPAAAL